MTEFMLPPLGDNELSDRIREALDEPFGDVQVMTPQFTRTNGCDPWWTPSSAADFDAIKTAPDGFLRSLGLAKWDDDDPTLWLYPGEWYKAIPEGYEIVDINGLHEPFKREETDDDIRFGCLAYGFIR